MYYGISVPSTHGDSTVLIVGTENNTIIKLTVTQPVSISIYSAISNLSPGRQYTFVINRLQTVYIVSRNDLSGTKIITNKPVSLFCGNKCGNIPLNAGHCSHLIEQIPPTKLWGEVYYIVPFANKRLYTIKILAAYNFTVVNIYCNNTMTSYTIHEGKFFNKTFQFKEYCVIYSNKKVLIVQFSHGGTEDDLVGDPTMILVPSKCQYLNKFAFSTICNPLTAGYGHYINIIVMAQYYQPDMIYLTTKEVNKSLIMQQWIPVQVNDVTKAYTTQVNISEGITKVYHSNPLAQMMVIVYGFTHSNGYGHIGGIYTG